MINKKLITDPLDEQNPVTVQVLGICSALAITVQVKQAIVMGLSVIVVLAFSNLITSLLRNTIPNRIRIIVQLVIVASLVTLVDQVLKAYAYDVSKALAVFVGLIITNCIIMGRIEAFSLANKPFPSIIDGIGNGLAYTMVIVIVSIFREVFGSGTIMGYQIIPEFMYQMGYKNNGLMILPPMALILVGLYIWVQRARNKNLFEEN